jgi:secreted trypsin-like serine protease
MHVNKWIKSGPLWLGAVVATGALVAMSGGTAMAAPRIAPAARQSVVPLDKLPKNAVPYHGSLPKVGATGTAFPAGTSSGGATTRVVGGSPANAADYPYIAGIQTYFLAEDSSGTISEYVATCTGTVISSTQVLTAGHCDTDLPFGTTFVILGRDTLSDTSSGYVGRVQSTWTDQNFNLAALNNVNGTVNVPTDDVAVLTLEAPVPSAYTPVTLTAQGDSTPYTAGTSATIVGYGETTAENSNTVGTLYQATVQIQSDTTCAGAMGTAEGYNPGYEAASMTCAGNPPSFGVDSCNGDSGGPLLVSGDEAGITDWGSASCGAVGTYGVYERLSYYNSLITGAEANPSIINLDFTGDGHSGLMTVDGSGTLWYYAGSGFLNDGFNGFAGWLPIGSGWGGFKKVFRVTNFNGDDTESIMAVTSNGNLDEWNTDGDGDFLNNGAATLIGTGWTEFSDIMVVNNWTGDGNADLLGRTPSGNLYLYEHTATGWANNGIGQLIGTGWNEFNTVITPGDWEGNGDEALIGRTPNGNLYLYQSTETAKPGWQNGGIGQQIGTGWNVFSAFLSPGDFNGDGLIDMMGITPGGALDLYETDGHGNWLNGGAGIQIGTGWNAFKAVF